MGALSLTVLSSKSAGLKTNIYLSITKTGLRAGFFIPEIPSTPPDISA